MLFTEAEIIAWFSQYAYQPWLVYTAIICMMVASSFGVPIPEEVTLISAGIVSYIGSRPDLYPPPHDQATGVDIYLTAIICFFSVFLSDYLVYTLGRVYGTRLLRLKFFQKKQQRMDKIIEWTTKYGMWAAGFFRFTPGLRFPGHFSCGMMGLSQQKFLFVDGLAALVSVPTQVLLIAYFGESIISNIQQLKIVLGVILVVLAVVYVVKRLHARRLAS